MAAKTISMLQVKRILQLLNKGESKRSITRQMGLSRNTVRNYVRLIKDSGRTLSGLLELDDQTLISLLQEQPPGICRLTNQERYLDFQQRISDIEKELVKTGVTRELLWQEYKMDYPNGFGYSQFCHYLSEHQRKKDTVMHFEHKPAEKLLVDFAGKTISYTNAEGKEVSCQIFISILPYSGYTYVEAVHSQQQGDFVHCLENALLNIGGVPQCILSDNLKSCVKRANRYEPQLTELMEQFSLHYNTTVMATRVCKPRDKASVEKAVDLTYQRVYAPLRNRTFSSLPELNAAIREQTQTHHNRPFRHSDQSRLMLFEADEKNRLNPLPIQRMDIHYIASAKVQRNYHIVLGQDWHYYSVPYQYTGKQVKVIYTHTLVEIYYEQQRIAMHPRNPLNNNYTTLKEHMPPNHIHYAQTKGWNADYFRNRAAILTPEIAQTIEQLLKSRQFYEQTYNACLGILRLADKYTIPRLSTACSIALKANAVSYKFINNILKNNMDQRHTTTPSPIQTSLPLHDNLRGAEAYQ